MQSKEPFLFIFYTLILVLFLIKVNIIYMPFSSDVIAIRFVYIFFYYGSKNTRELQGKFSKPHFSTNCISLYKYRIVRFFNATAGLFSFFGVFSLKGTPPSTQKTNIFSRGTANFLIRLIMFIIVDKIQNYVYNIKHKG